MAASLRAATAYTFLTVWHDQHSDLDRHFFLKFYQGDATIEMVDVKNKRLFLKRCPYPALHFGDLRVGNAVTVYGRQLRIVDYGDAWTREQLASSQSASFGLIEPAAYEVTGKVLSSIERCASLSLGRVRMVQLSPQQAASFLGEQNITVRAQALSKGPAVAFEVVGKGAVSELANLVSNGGSIFRGVLTAPSETRAAQDVRLFFESPGVIGGTAKLDNVTCCIIKPHAVQSGCVGDIVDSVLSQGFEVSALQSFILDREAAVEFLEVYKGVVPEFNDAVEHLVSGSCVAMEVRSDGRENVVEKFRQFAGPRDPVVAKHIRAGTLRARFGVDKVDNGVHCTDLPEDGELESEFFFTVLQQAKK